MHSAIIFVSYYLLLYVSPANRPTTTIIARPSMHSFIHSFIPFHSISFRFVAFHCISLCFIALHFIAFQSFMHLFHSRSIKILDKSPWVLTVCSPLQPATERLGSEMLSKIAAHGLIAEDYFLLESKTKP